MNRPDAGGTTLSPETVLDYWFSPRVRKCWWKMDAAFDAELRRLFGDLHRAAVEGGLPAWRKTPQGRLAEVIVLDQFSRNLYRDRPEAFAQDARARTLTREAVAAGADRALPPEKRAFLYMPLMHSESASDHEEAMRLFESDPALAYNLKFEKKHKAIIDRFGRYPHRNEILGRESTAEERAFLEQPGSRF